MANSTRPAAGALGLVMILGALAALVWPASAHSGGGIDSNWASTAPTIDGTMDPGEWSDATAVDLGAIPGNRLSALLLVKNNGTLLWFAYDAVNRPRV